MPEKLKGYLGLAVRAGHSFTHGVLPFRPLAVILGLSSNCPRRLILYAFVT